jgi:hypothetical protein
MAMKKLVLAHMAGMGGDMVRSCLYPLLVPGNWEWKPCDDEFYDNTILAEDEFMGLHWNNNLIAFIDIRGQAQVPAMYNRHRWDEELEEGKHTLEGGEANKEVLDMLFILHKRHYSEAGHDIKEIIEEAEDKEELNPVVTFLIAEQYKYLDLAHKNMLIKKSHEWYRDDAIQWWDDEYEKAKALKNHNQLVFNEENRKHCFIIDTIYEWESFKQELKNYMGFYHLDHSDDNFPVIKLFWQAWIDEQRIKVE